MVVDRVKYVAPVNSLDGLLAQDCTVWSSDTDLPHMLSYDSDRFGLRQVERELLDTPDRKEDTDWDL